MGLFQMQPINYILIREWFLFVIVTINGCPSVPSDTITINNVSIQFYNSDDLVIILIQQMRLFSLNLTKIFLKL